MGTDAEGTFLTQRSRSTQRPNLCDLCVLRVKNPESSWPRQSQRPPRLRPRQAGSSRRKCDDKDDDLFAADQRAHPMRKLPEQGAPGTRGAVHHLLSGGLGGDPRQRCTYGQKKLVGRSHAPVARPSRSVGHLGARFRREDDFHSYNASLRRTSASATVQETQASECCR